MRNWFAGLIFPITQLFSCCLCSFILLPQDNWPWNCFSKFNQTMKRLEIVERGLPKLSIRWAHWILVIYFSTFNSTWQNDIFNLQNKVQIQLKWHVNIFNFNVTLVTSCDNVILLPAAASLRLCCQEEAYVIATMWLHNIFELVRS